MLVQRFQFVPLGKPRVYMSPDLFWVDARSFAAGVSPTGADMAHSGLLREPERPDCFCFDGFSNAGLSFPACCPVAAG